MAEANYSSQLFLLYLLLLPMIIYKLCSIAYNFLTEVERHCRCVGRSRRLYCHKGFRPKHQYRYHWFKARMKRKQRRHFRKPKPLFHLTTKGKLMIGTYLSMVRLHRLGQRITKYFQSFRDRL
jgi:hypothetical protein